MSLNDKYASSPDAHYLLQKCSYNSFIVLEYVFGLNLSTIFFRLFFINLTSLSNSSSFFAFNCSKNIFTSLLSLFNLSSSLSRLAVNCFYVRSLRSNSLQIYNKTFSAAFSTLILGLSQPNILFIKLSEGFFGSSYSFGGHNSFHLDFFST